MNENESLPPDDAPVPPPQAAGPQPVPDAVPADADASPVPVPVPDAPVELPGAAPASLGSKGAARPLPETLTAARDAAAFVAQLFAEVSAPEQAAPAAPADEVPSAPDDAVRQALEDAPAPAAEAVRSPLEGLAVLILGLGASGLAMARWCVRMGARVTVADTREAPPQLATLQAELPQVSFRAGPLVSGLVEGSDIRAVFRSPGLSPALIAPVWQAAQAMGLWVGGELDLFARALQDLQAERAYAPRVLAITGTNGKTTTTALTGQLVAQAGAERRPWAAC